MSQSMTRHEYHSAFAGLARAALARLQSPGDSW